MWVTVWNNLMSARGRAVIYGTSASAVALLAAYGMISADKVPLWLGLIATLLGVAAPATALAHLTPDSLADDGDSTVDTP